MQIFRFIPPQELYVPLDDLPCIVVLPRKYNIKLHRALYWISDEIAVIGDYWADPHLRHRDNYFRFIGSDDHILVIYSKSPCGD